MDKYDYRTSHCGKSFGRKYDERLFKVGGFDSEMWKREQTVLANIISKYTKGGRLLDFACGTGRILRFLENYFEESRGIDLSPDMLERAKLRVKKAELICGDITKNPDIVDGKFDCITSFRFFLNAQNSLRHETLRFLESRLKGPDSVFIFNIHGNKFSTICLMVVKKRLFDRGYQNHMSINEVRRMLKPHSLEIIEYYSVGFIHEVFFRFMPNPIWHFLEDIFGSITSLKPFSLYPIFVCKKIS